jgi:hypothetical protein
MKTKKTTNIGPLESASTPFEDSPTSDVSIMGCDCLNLSGYARGGVGEAY